MKSFGLNFVIFLCFFVLFDNCQINGENETLPFQNETMDFETVIISDEGKNGKIECITKSLNVLLGGKPIQMLRLVVTERDMKHFRYFQEHLDEDSLIENGTQWKDPSEKLHFYIKVLVHIDDTNRSGNSEPREELHMVPIHLLKKKVARVNAALLR